jgi:hypothetical protein
MAMAIATLGAIVVFVPMAVAVGYMSVISVSLWEAFNRITILIPILALSIAILPLKFKSQWAWRVPLAVGIVSVVCGLGMIVELLFFLRGRAPFGFHPTGISLVVLIGLLLTAEALVSRRDIRMRLTLRERKCLKCGYDLRATPARCPECGCVPPNANVGVGTS